MSAFEKYGFTSIPPANCRTNTVKYGQVGRSTTLTTTVVVSVILVAVVVVVVVVEEVARHLAG